MPRAQEDCRALPVAGPGAAIREVRAAQAIGPRSETDIRTEEQLGIFTAFAQDRSNPRKLIREVTSAERIRVLATLLIVTRSFRSC